MIMSADTIWIAICTVLVFFMQTGFAMLETGFTRKKNSCNVIMKNIMDFSHSPYCIENNPDKDYTSNKHLKLLSDWKLTTY